MDGIPTFVEIISTCDYLWIALSFIFFSSILTRSANSRPFLNSWQDSGVS